MLQSTAETVGNWNPQLWREWKGRLTRRNILLTLGASLGLQVLIGLGFSIALPDSTLATLYNYYCTGAATEYGGSFECVRNAAGKYVVNWQLWWLELSRVFTYMFTLALPVAGVYLLVGDLVRERQRGTINFIRLSPRSGFNILLGKLLGVPILPCLAVIAGLPLHLVSSLAGGMPPLVLIGYYALLILLCGAWYSAAMLYTFLGASYAWLATLITYGVMQTYVQLLIASFDWNPFRYQGFNEDLLWYYLPTTHSMAIAYGLTWLIAVFSIVWIWKLLQRRFHTPNATILRKAQSYWMTLGFTAINLGFFIPFFTHRDVANYAQGVDIAAFIAVNLVWSLFLIASLSPHRQSLQEWARFRWSRTAQPMRHRTALKDLIWGEYSPAPVAVGINAAIAVLPFAIHRIVVPGYVSADSVTISLLGFASLVVLYGILSQLILYLPLKRGMVWAAAVVGGMVFIPPIAVAVLGTDSLIFLMTPTSVVPFMVGLSEVSVAAFVFGFIGQAAIATTFGFKLSRQLALAGQSESQEIFAKADSLPPLK